ncbi:MAG: hypothetical protein ABIM89_00805 [Mycobacteriales bacterium]
MSAAHTSAAERDVTVYPTTAVVVLLWDRRVVLPPQRIPGFGECPCSPGTPPAGVEFRPERFRDLSPDGRRLIQRWAKKAGDALPPSATQEQSWPTSQAGRANAFEAFIYAWISFNGWASCCLEDEQDSLLVRVLRTERSLCDTFDNLVRNDLQVAHSLQRFHALWPIFRAADVRSGHLPGEPRAIRVRRYAVDFPHAGRAPNCHLRHVEVDLPADWGHALAALYQVRCNLFHGTKSVFGIEDREIVDSAAGVLVPMVRRLVLGPQ